MAEPSTAASWKEAKTLPRLLDRINEAQQLLCLMGWIENARTNADALTQAEADDEELAEKLRRHRVGTCWPWDSVESAGLSYLMGHVRELLTQADDIGTELHRQQHPEAA